MVLLEYYFKGWVLFARADRKKKAEHGSGSVKPEEVNVLMGERKTCFEGK